jgi:two-component sensor histidine kinase
MQTGTAPAGTMSNLAVLPPVTMPSAADEVNHRVANHLQLIAALISVEARDVTDPVTLAVLERTRDRITAIGGLHRQLYRAGTADVDLGSYLEDLGEQLSQSWAPYRHVLVDADTVLVGGAIAASVGILATELVTNACKHAYAPDEAGDVWITLRRLANGAHRLIVQDRGHGRSTHDRASGLGSRLIQATAAKLGGVCAWEDAQPGTSFRMDVRI